MAKLVVGEWEPGTIPGWSFWTVTPGVFSYVMLENDGTVTVIRERVDAGKRVTLYKGTNRATATDKVRRDIASMGY